MTQDLLSAYYVTGGLAIMGSVASLSLISQAENISQTLTYYSLLAGNILVYIDCFNNIKNNLENKLNNL